jgi:hypothetical protein
LFVNRKPRIEETERLYNAGWLIPWTRIRHGASIFKQDEDCPFPQIYINLPQLAVAMTARNL